jgi:Rrf2 family protein
MLLSQKSQYALRAVFELARRHGQGPVRAPQIAEAQAVPPKFLGVILHQLKQAGFVESKRGQEGGYVLARHPRDLTVGELLRFIEGPVGPVDCLTPSGKNHCPLDGQCVFMPLWQRVQDAVNAIYDGTTLQDLLDQEQQRTGSYVPSFTI